MSLESKIEALLFWKGEPVSMKELTHFFETDAVTIETSISALEKNLEGRGLVVVRNGDEFMLYTSPNANDIIKKLTKEELAQDLTKSATEVLSLVIYKGPISKRDIDYIRGVNSSYIVRNLMVRGLIERVESKDARSFMYKPTFELLAHVGITKIEELPEFGNIQNDLKNFMMGETVSKEEHGQL